MKRSPYPDDLFFSTENYPNLIQRYRHLFHLKAKPTRPRLHHHIIPILHPSPAIILRDRGVSMRCWMARLRGRAPKTGS